MKDANERIIDAAMKEFKAKGYEQASMKAIASEAGVTAVDLYRRYECKQDLFDALVQPAAVKWKNAVVSAADYYLGIVIDNGEIRLGVPTRNFWEDHSYEENAHDFIVFVMDRVLYRYPDEFYLLKYCANGSSYENLFTPEFTDADRKALDMLAAADGDRSLLAGGVDSSCELLWYIANTVFAMIFEPLRRGCNHDEALAYLESRWSEMDRLLFAQ